MFPTGSRLLLGATALTTIAAISYGISNGGSLGTTGLIFAAAALVILTAINLYTRDADVSSMDPAASTDSPAARPAPWSSLWPAVAALGGVLIVVGLVTYPVVFVFGVIAVLAAAVEWMVEAWAERASGDAGYNTGIRQRFAHPVEFPVLAALAFGIIVYSFSRIMLFLDNVGGPVAFGTIALLVLGGGFLVAFREDIGNAAVAGVAGIALVGLVAGGIASALAGERELHAHLNTLDLAAGGECASAEETEADENASRSVAAKADIDGELVLTEAGALVATAEGINGEVSEFVVTRSNATGVRFRNESGEERRLTLEYAQLVDNEAEQAQRCTALVGEGGSQLLTFRINRPSAADGPFRFYVPGVDGAEVEVVVP